MNTKLAFHTFFADIRHTYLILHTLLKAKHSVCKILPKFLLKGHRAKLLIWGISSNDIIFS